MLGKQKEKPAILIVGGFHKAMALAKSLLKSGYRVTVVNKSREDCDKLAEIPRLNVIYGDGSKRFVLEDADARACRAAIALTDSDETNLIICEMCKQYFGVKKTISLLNDPGKSDFFYQMGVDRAVCALTMIANILETQATMDEMTGMIPLENGRIHIAELPVLSGSPMAGHRLWELNLPKEIIVGCVLRGDQSLIPRGDTTIAEGDALLVITSDKTRLEKLKGLTPYASR